MDTFTIKLIIFAAIVFAIRFFVRQFPDSLFTRIIYSWHGPAPKDKETKSHYLFILALYSLKWVLFFVLTLFIVMTTADRFFHDQYKDNLYFQMLFMFGVPLLSLMAFAGSVGCLVKGTYLKVMKKDSRFDAALNEFTRKTEE